MAKISTDTIEAINADTDIVDLINQYTRLENRGADWWGCCPFHNEKTPSFHVVPEKKMYYCFGCGKGGGVINFVMEIDKLSFVEAVTYIAKKNGIEIKYEGNYDPQIIKEINEKDQILELYNRVAGSFHYLLTETSQGKNALNYLTKRHVSLDCIKKFRLGYAPKNRKWLYDFLKKKGYSSEFLQKSGLFSKKYPQSAFFSDRLMFPICDRKGRVVAFSARILNGEGPKYINSSEMPQYKKGETLFGFDLAFSEIRTTKSVILCEGNMDVLAWHQAGVTRAVASLGTSFTEDQAHLIRTLADTVYLSFDADQAGDKATVKTILLCRRLKFNVRVLNLTKGKDPSDILMNEGAEALKKILEYSIIDLEYLVLLANKKFDVSIPEGKTLAISFMFQYLEVLESDIQRESTIQRLSAIFGVSEKALHSDYISSQQKNKHKSIDTQANKKNRVIKKDAELRIMLAVISNTDFFSTLRSELTPDDFINPIAKELFITVEECYRLDSLSYDSLFSKIKDEELKQIISEIIHDGEFSNHAEEIVLDGIMLIKKSILERNKAKLLSELNLLCINEVDNVRSVNEIIFEIQNIDKQLIKMKEQNNG